VSDELRQLRVPTLLLQPLVENAIKHGISESRVGGKVQITAELIEPDTPNPTLRLVVGDTGVGGSSLQFASGRNRGVGLNNVEKRLKFYEKNTAHMKITSKPGVGTQIELALPLKPTKEPVGSAK
jgi:sensor histidine kinase YesM